MDAKYSLNNNSSKMKGLIRRYWGVSQSSSGHPKGRLGPRILSVRLGSLCLVSVGAILSTSKGLLCYRNRVVDSSGLCLPCLT